MEARCIFFVFVPSRREGRRMRGRGWVVPWLVVAGALVPAQQGMTGSVTAGSLPLRPCFMPGLALPAITGSVHCGRLGHSGMPWRPRHCGILQTRMQTRKALCGLWSIVYEIENGEHEATVWLEESGSMRPMKTPVVLSAGRWSVKGQSILLYHRRMGELSHSWTGQVLEEQTGNASANVSRSIVSGIIQQGDSDAEFLGHFEARQTLAAFTKEELLEDEFASQRPLVPLFSMDHLIGAWSLKGDLYDDPLLLSPVHLHANGTFECVNKDHGVSPVVRRFAGRWGLYRDSPDDSVQENRENPSTHAGCRRQGTHFWMWAQRGECRGFNMNADYRLVGRIKPSAVDDHLQLSMQKAAAEPGGRGGGARGGGEFEVSDKVCVCVEGVIFWGNIADMEYSDLAGKFSLSLLAAA